jgi:hypothetical protein
MKARSYIFSVISFFLYVGVQVLLIKNLVLYNTAYCFLYVAFILLLPLEISTIWLLLIAFITGFSVDIFYDSLGINAAACVLLAFIRPYWLSLVTPRGGYEDVRIPKLKTLGFFWFLSYALPLIFIHHLALFYLEAGGFQMFFVTFSKVIFSAFLTFFVVVLSQYLFYRNPY